MIASLGRYNMNRDLRNCRGKPCVYLGKTIPGRENSKSQGSVQMCLLGSWNRQ